MAIELINDSRRRLFKEVYNDFDLVYSLETEGSEIRLLTCNGSKLVEDVNNEGVITQLPSGVTFVYHSNGERPTATATNTVLTETMQDYVKKQFDEIVSMVSGGKEIVLNKE